MQKKLAIACSLGALATVGIAPTSASAATSDYRVQVKHRPAIVHHNGSVTAVFWLRCKAGFNAFEYDVGLSQDGVAAGTGEGGANILTCDGTRHRVKVTFGEGFRPGPADITVFVGIFDPVQGNDIAAEDSAHIRLRFAH